MLYDNHWAIDTEHKTFPNSCDKFAGILKQYMYKNYLRLWFGLVLSSIWTQETPTLQQVLPEMSPQKDLEIETSDCCMSPGHFSRLFQLFWEASGSLEKYFSHLWCASTMKIDCSTLIFAKCCVSIKIGWDLLRNRHFAQ